MSHIASRIFIFLKLCENNFNENNFNENILTKINFKEHTASAASLMNCLAASFQIAGTVSTQWISSALSPPLARRCWDIDRRSSLRYFIHSENISFAGSFFSIASSNIISLCMPCCIKRKQWAMFLFLS